MTRFLSKYNITIPYFFSVSLLIAALGMLLFLGGTDDLIFAPAIITTLAFLGFTFAGNLTPHHGKISIPRSAVTILITVFMLWAIFALQFSHVPFVSTFFTINLCFMPLLFLGLVLHPDKNFIRLHTGVAALVLGITALWAVIQFVFMYDPNDARIHHPMLNPNNLAGLFNLGTLPALAFLLYARGRTQFIAATLLFALLFMALAVTQSRGGLLAFAVSSFILIIVTTASAPLKSFKWQRILLALAIISLSMLCVHMGSEGRLGYALGQISSFQTTNTMQGRFILWSGTLKIMADHLWTGIGLGTFFFFYPQYRQPADTSDGFFAHMDSIQFGAEMGIVATVLFYAILIAILLRTIFALRALEKNDIKRLYIFAPFCAMFAVALHTHMTFHLYMPGILAMMGIYLAFWYQQTEQALNDSDKRLSIPLNQTKKVVLAVIIIAAYLPPTTFALRTAWGVYYTEKAMEFAIAKDHEQSRKYVTMAGKFAPDSFARYYEYEARFPATVVLRGAKLLDKAVLQEQYDKAIYYINEAEKRNPVFTHLWDMKARLYSAVDGILIDDGREQAIKMLQKIIIYNPLAIDSRLKLAQMYEELGDKQTAAKILADGAKWPRPMGTKDVAYLVKWAALYKDLGRQDLHDNIMREAQTRAKRYGMTTQKK
jgi:tetratricopeptide (TPR) repeat protein